ncbi:type II toxin-antitoxin system HipA family toxin [Paracoccus litorisediminis]|uniref:type II toxin-antitoxin system HipA family toxin n=1 Tax=Paracoccus litorisediminis TaxID=2006130 RepID=UPI00372F6ADC
MRMVIESHQSGSWCKAAEVQFLAPEAGIQGETLVSYDADYFFDLAVVDAMNADVIDCRALSVSHPVSMNDQRAPHWPAWLLDLLPQGVARQKIARDAGLAANDPAVEVHLLRRAGGSPIGNLRIREAWREEQERLRDVQCPPLTDEDIDSRSESFLEVVDRFAHLASGSSGVQGEWPKALMTRSTVDGFWYPDPFVPTDEGCEHMIVKLLRSSQDSDRAILESEAPYLEVARHFGLNVATPLGMRDGLLRMPRFDRSVAGGDVLLHGQESLVSALGIAGFGYRGSHEEALRRIQAVSDDPAADTIEYIQRDLLNLAMGNPDNHGRNTALAKPATGGVRLSPLFDFVPMRLSDAGIPRVMRWACLEGRDMEGDWGLVCAAAAFDGLDAGRIRNALLEKMPALEALPQTAREIGVREDVIQRCIDTDRLVQAIAKLDE